MADSIPFDVAEIEQGNFRAIADALFEQRATIKTGLELIAVQLADIMRYETGEVFLTLDELRFDGDILITGESVFGDDILIIHETGAYIAFADTTDGIAGYVGVGTHLIGGASVDQLGLWGSAGMQFTANTGPFMFNSGSTVRLTIGSLGNIELNSETHAYIGFNDITDGVAGYIGIATQIMVSGTVDRLALRGNDGIEFSANTGATINAILNGTGRWVLIGESQCYVHFEDTTDGLAGMVGVAQHLITGAIIDRLGVRGNNGIEFSADGGTTKTMIMSASNDVSIQPTKGLYFDGGSDTYIYESGANALRIVAGAAAGNIYLDAAAVVIPSTRGLYLDGGSDTYIYEPSGNNIDLIVGGTQALRAFLLSPTTPGIALPAQSYLFFDGGGDTFIREDSANVLQFWTGGGKRLTLNAAGSVIMEAGNKFFLDGGGDTYIDEASADNFRIIVGGLTVFQAASDDVVVSANDDIFLISGGDILLSTPLGNVQFGTHSAIGAETVTGYITIKDAAGNTRKLAVVS